MIGQHPDAFGLPELNLFNVERLKDFWRPVSHEIGGDSNRRHGVLRTVAEIYAGEQTPETINMALHWVAVREDRKTEEVFKEIVSRIDPLIPVEKSPAYTISMKRLTRIFETFPDARFLHLVRHPIPQSKSIAKLNDGIFAFFFNAFEFENNRLIVDPQIIWHDININILNFLDIVPKDQQMRMRGEELMEHPQKQLAIVCRWLGIRDDDNAIEEMMHPERSPFACFGPINALFGNDPNFLRGSAFRQHKPKIPPLDEPLPWREDGKGLRMEVLGLAQDFGYK
ncbi:ABC-type oligopeptide transport system, periplasmic component [Candidatus Scalindua japonica]|uniref:ABC-type oligopeptide transport system, periplasmic component n=2 Tax=Candidatus Scalindua japonica TaxID=1284222 RepID=A0A286TUU4_9BACT|nr:ABC-type oligopeptide transport system, periplasmic component [Candidatus Scalindua japonica]